MDTFLVKLGIGLSSSCEPLRACTRTCNATRRQLGYVPAVGHVMVLAADVVSVRIPARASRFLCFHHRKSARGARPRRRLGAPLLASVFFWHLFRLESKVVFCQKLMARAVARPTRRLGALGAALCILYFTPDASPRTPARYLVTSTNTPDSNPLFTLRSSFVAASCSQLWATKGSIKHETANTNDFAAAGM